jgi:hypothetical protein
MISAFTANPFLNDSPLGIAIFVALNLVPPLFGGWICVRARRFWESRIP